LNDVDELVSGAFGRTHDSRTGRKVSRPDIVEKAATLYEKPGDKM
jgi:hypothetical protein